MRWNSAASWASSPRPDVAGFASAVNRAGPPLQDGDRSLVDAVETHEPVDHSVEELREDGRRQDKPFGLAPQALDEASSLETKYKQLLQVVRDATDDIRSWEGDIGMLYNEYVEARRVELPRPTVTRLPVTRALASRRSRREHRDTPSRCPSS